MNRPNKRMRPGSSGVDPDGAAALPPSLAPGSQISLPARIVEFFREIRSELRQVAWPTRAEVANSAAVVFIVLVLLVLLIFLLNYAFSHGVLKLLTT